MSLLWELVRKDLRLFVSDKRALLISFAMPVAIASFIAMLFSSMGQDIAAPAKKIPLLVVDKDSSSASKALFDSMKAGKMVSPTTTTEEDARATVLSGNTGVAVIIPKGFGDQGLAALMPTGGTRPNLRFLYDPTSSIQLQAVRGLTIELAMKALTKDIPNAPQDLPFTTSDEPLAAEKGMQWSGSAHAFAGMAVQGLLFWTIEASMVMMRERRLGLWRRIRAAPVSPLMLLLGRWLSAALRGLLILFVVFGFGSLFFHYKVEGSWIGFGLLCVCSALMTSAFGLFVAAQGRNEQQSRGLVVFIVLAMSMLGGAWFPAFLMPQWVQNVSLAIPVRWAIDGFDSMLWRGQGLTASLIPSAVLLGFTALFGIVAYYRFSWDPEP